MIGFVVVGTSAIATQFVAAATEAGWRLSGVVASSRAKAEAFAAANGAPGASAFDSAAAAAAHPWDLVYIASPNSLHFEQAMEFLAAGTPVVVEKPAFANLRELTEALQAADRAGTPLIEAARHVFEPNFWRVRDALADLGGITGASFPFRQYSRMAPLLRAGERPRVFTAEFAGGALADLGVYQLYAALAWFGVPASAGYRARLLPDTGVDLEGIGRLDYGDWSVSLSVSKVQHSEQRTEIYGADGSTLSIDAVASVASIRRIARGQQPQELLCDPPAANPLAAEVAAIGRLLASGGEATAGIPGGLTLARLRELAIHVATTRDRMRSDAGIVYPTDRLARG